jgi:CHAT domain-containing protein/tetratricopeptide (TPR) repeat protein
MQKLSNLLLYSFLLMMGSCLHAQRLQTSNLYDSLQTVLKYFNDNSNDTAFKYAIKKAQTIFAESSGTDSLAKQLMVVENLLLKLSNDSNLLNRHPFKQQMVFVLGNMVVSLSQSLYPQKQNLYYAKALNNLGLIYNSSWEGKPANTLPALDLFEKALVIRKKITSENDIDYTEYAKILATVYALRNENEKAKAMLLQALSINKKITGEGSYNYADDLFTLAVLCREMKKYDTAMLLFDEAINIRKKAGGEENSYYALCLLSTGDMMLYQWQYQKAFIYYQQALSITERTIGKENIQNAYCLEGLASYYYNTGDYKQAAVLSGQALVLKEKLYGKNYYDNGVTLHNLATDYFKMGNYELTIPYLQRVIALQKENVTLPQNYAYELNWEGSVYQSIGNNNKALSFYKQAIAIPDYKHAKQRYANTLSNIASLYERLNENKLALLYLDKAKTATKAITGELSPDYANILYNLSALYEKLNMHVAALQLCCQAMAIRKKIYGEMHPQYAASLMQLGNICMQTNKEDSAERCFNYALAIQKNISGEENPDYIKNLNSLALLQAAEKKNKDAAFTIARSNQSELKYITRTYTSLSEREKIEFENDQYYQFSYLPSFVYHYNNKEPRLLQQLYEDELMLKGMVLKDQQSLLNNIRKSKDSTVINLYNKWRINKIIIGQQLLLPKNERLKDFDALNDKTIQLEQELSRTSAAFRQERQMLSVKNIADKLLSNEAAIEFIKFQYYNKKFTDSILYAALIVMPGDSIPKFVPLFEEKQLLRLLNREGKNENSINNFYLADNNNKLFSCSGNALFNLIWAPLEKYFAGINTIYYSPVGLLHRIAFKALPVDASHFLVDIYQLNQMLSTRSIVMSSEAQKKPSLINIWSNIEYDQKPNADKQIYHVAERGIDTNFYHHTLYKWTALNNTKLEMDSIKNIFINAGIDVFAVTGTNATEEAFKAMDGSSAQVLHIATHGFFWSIKDKLNNNFIAQQDPMLRSGIVLAGANNLWRNKKINNTEDGILTSYEIAGIDLSNTDLIVLSACETALGDLQGNEGVIGLQRALKLAGVKQMIISLWRIPDKQTAELMTAFYRNWLNGESTQKALRSAQLFMKTKYPPYDWAGFVLVE